MHRPALTAAPLAAALAALLSGPAYAAQSASPGVAAAAGPAAADAERSPTELDTVEVEALRMRKASSPKYTQELVDTPQTITVVTKQTIDQQNLLSLRDVLSTLPGITFGAGEGGGGYGDKINLRGFNADADITTDGIRDSALYTRSDTFNLEAIEVINGANSVYAGAGSVGGNINLVSKMAREGDSHAFTLGAGSDRYGRVTADSNLDFDNGVALRLNAMGHSADVPGRDHEFNHRWGFAPSLAIGLGSDTRFTLNYLHQEDHNLPQYGVPYALNAFNDGPLPGVDRETYFGYRNVADQDIEVDVLTGILDMDFGEGLSLRSLGRLQRVDQLSVAIPLSGAWCLENGTDPYTGGACANPGTWTPAPTQRGVWRDTTNFIAASQTDLTARFDTGAVSHTLVAGVSLHIENFELDNGGLLFTASGAPVPHPPQSLDDPYNIWTGPVNYIRSGRTEGELTNQAVYLFDTLEFGPQWLLNLGTRFERNEGSTKTFGVSSAPGSIGEITGLTGRFENDDDLFSYRAGLVYKPVENASVYLSYANSKTPSKASVSGACNSSNCNVDPETAVNTELGLKWDLLDRRLALTAAVFRNERTNYRVADPGNPDNPSGIQQLDGEARVDGLALGIAGQVTQQWSVFANYTWLDSEVVRGVSRFCLENPSTACVNSAVLPDPFAGNPLTNTPEHSGSLWTTYALGDWTIGYGATYQGGYVTQNNSLAFPLLYETDDYWVHRAMVAWQLDDRLALQLNLENLADEEYYERIRNNATNGWATPGAGRSAVLTATYRF
jgi:catecholate siderophore receptor